MCFVLFCFCSQCVRRERKSREGLLHCLSLSCRKKEEEKQKTRRRRDTKPKHFFFPARHQQRQQQTSLLPFRYGFFSFHLPRLQRGFDLCYALRGKKRENKPKRKRKPRVDDQSEREVFSMPSSPITFSFSSVNQPRHRSHSPSPSPDQK